MTDISLTTLTRIEKGILSSNSETTEKLSTLYQISKTEIYNVGKPIPTWKQLRKRVLAAHRNNLKLLKALNKKSEAKLMIEYRVLRSSFLDSYRTARELSDHIKRRYAFHYTPSTIKNSLDILADAEVVERHKPDKGSHRYRRIRKVPQNLEEQLAHTQRRLEEMFSRQSDHLVTPAFDKMARMVALLSEGSKSRSELTEFVDYENTTRNINRSLRVLEELGIVERQYKDKPTNSKQRYQLTDPGATLLQTEE